MPSRHTPLRVAFARPWPGTRRGFCLWLFAIGFILLGGVNYIGTDIPPTTQAALAFAFTIAPPTAWGIVMVTCGVLAMWSSYCHFGRDRYGFTLLATLSGGWGMGYICGVLFYDAPLRGLGGAVVWFIYSTILATIAGFPNVALRQPPMFGRDA